MLLHRSLQHRIRGRSLHSPSCSLKRRRTIRGLKRRGKAGRRPDKLRLKGEIAKREADVSQQQVESVRRAVLAELKGVYFQLAYLSKTLAILEQDGELLKQVEQAADARYRSGLGTQQDVLQAQLQKT